MKKITIILTVLITMTITSNAQWTLVNDGIPTVGNNYVDALAISGSNIFAGLRSGGVYLSTNEGDLWSSVNNGLTNDTVTALAISGSNIFAGTLGGVFLSINNGSSWVAVNNGLTNTDVHSLAISGSSIFVGTENGIFLSNNNGGLWTAVNNGLPANTGVYSIIISGINIFAGTIFYGVYLSTNNGNNWTAAGLSGNWVNALAISGTNIFAGTSYGGMFLSTNNGGLWTAINNGLPASSNVYSLTTNGINIFAGTDGGVFISNNNGSLWTLWNNGLPTYYYAYAFATSTINIFAGSGLSRVYMRPLSEITKIEEINDNSTIVLYPNPAADYITLETPQREIIEIINIQGRLIKTIEASSNKTTINISGLTSGMYIVKIQTEKGVSINKIVKE